MNHLLEGIGFGLVTASLIGLAAVGVSLQFSVTNYLNFAYGDVMTVGAYLAYVLTRSHLPFTVAIIGAAVGTGIFGVLLNYGLFRPFVRMRARVLTMLIVTFGLSFIIQNVLVLVAGTGSYRYSVNLGQQHHIGPFRLSTLDLGILAASVILLSALHYGLKYTKYGKALRATSIDSNLAESTGINVERVVTWLWFTSSALAGLAGIGLALEVGSLQPGLGFSELFVIMAAVMVGGIGRPYGALLGAVIVGVVTEVAGIFGSSVYKTSMAFVVVILVLMFRPQGIISARGKTE